MSINNETSRFGLKYSRSRYNSSPTFWQPLFRQLVPMGISFVSLSCSGNSKFWWPWTAKHALVAARRLKNYKPASAAFSCFLNRFVWRLGDIVEGNTTKSSFSQGLCIGSSGFGAATTTTSAICFGSSFGFSGSAGFTFECFAIVQPGMLRNVEKSVDFLLQHDQPFRASWKTGTPEWNVHESTCFKYNRFESIRAIWKSKDRTEPSPSVLACGSNCLPQPLL